VFASPKRSRDHLFTVLAAPNDSAACRLGLAIAKRHVKKAVERNRIKRLVRESFRHSREGLAGLDVVVLARSGAAAQGNRRLRDSLAQHWRRLARLSAK